MSDWRPPHHDSTSALPLRILLVEDDRIGLDHVGRLLTDQGADVTGATSVREATELLQELAPFDLLLTDYVLPDGSGFEVARAAKGRVKHVVMMDSTLANVPLVESHAAGIEVLIPKFVITHRQLRLMIEELFGED